MVHNKLCIHSKRCSISLRHRLRLPCLLPCRTVGVLAEWEQEDTLLYLMAQDQPQQER